MPMSYKVSQVCILSIFLIPLHLSKIGEFRDASECLDVAVEGNYAYIAGADHETWEKGLMIVDISDPVNPFLVLLHRECHCL